MEYRYSKQRLNDMLLIEMEWWNGTFRNLTPCSKRSTQITNPQP